MKNSRVLSEDSLQTEISSKATSSERIHFLKSLYDSHWNSPSAGALILSAEGFEESILDDFLFKNIAEVFNRKEHYDLMCDVNFMDLVNSADIEVIKAFTFIISRVTEMKDFKESFEETCERFLYSYDYISDEPWVRIYDSLIDFEFIKGLQEYLICWSLVTDSKIQKEVSEWFTTRSVNVLTPQFINYITQVFVNGSVEPELLKFVLETPAAWIEELEFSK